MVQSIDRTTQNWPTPYLGEKLTLSRLPWLPQCLACVEGRGKVWGRRLGEVLLSLYLSGRVYLGTSQRCARLANTQGATGRPAKRPLPRITVQLLPCWEQEAHCHHMLWPSLSSGSLYHWPALLLRTACQSSHALQCEQAAAGQAANMSLLPWTGKKANSTAS